MLSFLHSARIQELNNDGRLLAGGKVYTYALNTTTPKASYSDIEGTSENTNPVILDSVGSADIYLNGSYSIWLYDANDVLLGPKIDIQGSLSDFITSGGGTFAENIVYSVNTYNDVRNISNPYSWVFVQGREANADGGTGLFFLDINSTDTDDSGVTLDPQTPGRYIRYNMTNIDPRWFGLEYDSSTSQAAFLLAAEIASARYALPVYINDSVYINSNYTTQSTSTWEFSNTAKLVSTLSVTMTFITGTKILSCGRRVFGNTVQPIFQKSVWSNDLINYSIMDADNVEGRIAKLEDCSSENYFVRFDESISTSVAPQLPSNFDLSYSGNVVTITATSPLSYRTSYDGVGQMFAYNLLASVGSVSVTGVARPEHFGSDNNIAFKCIASIGNGKLQAGSTYLIVENVLNGTDLSLIGDSDIDTANVRLSAASDVNLDRLYLDNILLRLDDTTVDVDSLIGKNCVLSASNDNAIGSLAVDLSNSYIYREAIFDVPASATYFDNVQISTSAGHRFYKNKSTFSDVYLREESKTPGYTTLLGINDTKQVITVDSLILPSISASNINYIQTVGLTSADYTFYEMDIFFNIDHTSVRVRRDGTQIAFYDATPSSVTINLTSADKSMIVVKNYTSDNRTALPCYIVPAAIPQNSNIITVISTGPFQIEVGDTTPGTYTTNTNRVLLPSALYASKNITGYYISGKWTF